MLSVVRVVCRINNAECGEDGMKDAIMQSVVRVVCRMQ